MRRRHRLKTRGCLPRAAAPANIGEQSTGSVSVLGKPFLGAFLPGLVRWTATFPIPATTAVHPQQSEEDFQRAIPARGLLHGRPSNRVPPPAAFVSAVRSDREERPSQTDAAPCRALTAYSPWSNEPRRCLTLLFPTSSLGLRFRHTGKLVTCRLLAREGSVLGYARMNSWMPNPLPEAQRRRARPARHLADILFTFFNHRWADSDDRQVQHPDGENDVSGTSLTREYDRRGAPCWLGVRNARANVAATVSTLNRACRGREHTRSISEKALRFLPSASRRCCVEVWC